MPLPAELPTDALQTVAVGAFVVLLMLSVGLDLSPGSIGQTFRRPRALLYGALAGYLMVPAWMLLLARVLAVEPGVRAGLLLCALAPGGPMGAYLTLVARGNVALAAALVLIFNLANTVAIPLGLGLLRVDGLDAGFDHLGEMALTILLNQILPLGVGMHLRMRSPARAARLQAACARAANALLLVVGLGVLLSQGRRVLEVDPRALLAVLLGVAGSWALGWLLAPAVRADRIALAHVGVVHATSTCILLATTWFHDPRVVLTVFAWSGTMFLFGLVSARLFAWRGAARAA